jgi:molybdenum cofactor cytidylyltransferase
MHIVPIVLAAGDSTRMGFPKVLLPIGSDIFLTRVLNTLENVGLTTATVVLGNHAEQILPRISGRRVRIVVNSNPVEGQLSSIKLALSHLEPSVTGCLIWPVDQPGVSEILIGALIELFIASGERLVLPRCGERRGHPAIFGRALFQEILETPLYEGLKKLVLRHSREIGLLPTDELATVEDIDTPEHYARFTGTSLEDALENARNSAIA